MKSDGPSSPTGDLLRNHPGRLLDRLGEGRTKVWLPVFRLCHLWAGDSEPPHPSELKHGADRNETASTNQRGLEGQLYTGRCAY